MARPEGTGNGFSEVIVTRVTPKTKKKFLSAAKSAGLLPAEAARKAIYRFNKANAAEGD